MLLTAYRNNLLLRKLQDQGHSGSTVIVLKDIRAFTLTCSAELSSQRIRIRIPIVRALHQWSNKDFLKLRTKTHVDDTKLYLSFK